jgi:peptidyl-dipeptidase A
MKGFIMRFLLVAALILGMVLAGCGPREVDDAALQKFIDQHQKAVEPLNKALALASWNANATGEQKFYDENARMEFEVRKIYSNRAEFDHLKKIKEAGQIKNPLLARQLIVLYNNYLGNQLDTILMKKIVDKQAEIAQKFNTFRGKIDGKEYADNEIRNILKTEKKSSARKKAWEASKQVGEAVAPLIIELVKLRNEAARKLGFENYYQMSLALGEQDEKEILAIFDELQKDTDEPFKKLKQGIDQTLAKRYGIDPGQMYPWHYEDPFFQEPPQVGSVDLDKYYKGKNIVELGRKFYQGIGLPADEILKNSDLFPRKGKYQHAFCTDIDRLGNVRMMCNITDNYDWMGTLNHEMGHAVYSKYIDPSLPYFLRDAAHTFTTEAIALLNERQASNAEWLGAMIGISAKEQERIRTAVHANLRLKEVLFSRWSQVMVHFEQSMYRNPDQDLNKLWWDLVEKYQYVKRPDGRNLPDWAAKIHLAQYPAYYHNYMLGSLTASQFLHSIIVEVYKEKDTRDVCFAGKTGVGTFMKEKIFKPGMTYRWDEFIKKATGEPLTSKYFVEEFVTK